MDAETRASILAEAREWINTPYEHKAKIKGLGTDCGQYIHSIFSKHLVMRPMPDYSADWGNHQGSGELYLDYISDYTHEVPSPEAAGIVLFKIGLWYCHCGIVTEKNTVIHAWGRTRYGSVQEKPWRFFRQFERKYFVVRL